ncbi:MAG: NAD(P)H-binding protein [Actinobacteria bacterium]|nr:NAD(P)H-binding protein [Actinomycetota bacterium]
MGSHIARRLLDGGRKVRTLTYHPDREHPLRARVEAFKYDFDDIAELERSLAGITTLYNTYWVRIEHDGTTFDEAVRHSRVLFDAAVRAGVKRIVHVSVSNPSEMSPLPYYSGKARVERALAESGASHAIVRPTLVFGSDREVLVNNIAYLLRKLPVFGVPGDGNYRVQPVHVDDVAEICVDQAATVQNVTVDAAGPETYTFIKLVRLIRDAIGARAVIARVPVPLMSFSARLLGVLLRDVVLTREETDGLMHELLVTQSTPLGRTSFSAWLDESAQTLGGEYANELARHFR